MRPAHGGFDELNIRLAAVVAGLVLLMHVTPSWGQLVNPTVSDANGNTAGGTGALQSLPVSGLFNNTAFGFDALLTNVGGFNTAIGANALRSNSSGNSNTASGVDALTSNTGGFQNTATGLSALRNNTTGFQNTASGAFALNSNIGVAPVWWTVNC